MRNAKRAVLLAVFGALIAHAATVNINLSATHQTIEGFGGHNHITKWKVKEGPFYVDVPLDGQYDTMAYELGLSMVRGWEIEGFNPSPGVYTVPGALAEKFGHTIGLLERGVDRHIISVLAPPAWMKSNNDYAHGGILLPEHYDEFAEFIVHYIDTMQARTGVKPYAFSLQNELMFEEPYGSCEYTPQQYRDALKVVGPALDAAGHSDVRIFGAEHMLWGIANYEDAVFNDGVAAPYLDIIAVHNYTDGIQPTPGSEAEQNWTNAGNYARSHGRPLWMTETSGYAQTWSGALEVASFMYAALQYGHMAGWCWLAISAVDGHERLMNEYGLTPLGVASKHYFRFIRPGAQMVDCDDTDDNTVFATAYRHDGDNTVSVVILNTGSSAKTANLTGAGLPASFDVYQSTESQACALVGTASTSVSLPARSITSLYNGEIPQYPYTSVKAKTSRAKAATAALGAGSVVEVFRVDGRRVARLSGGVDVHRAVSRLDLARGGYYAVTRARDGTVRTVPFVGLR